LFRNEAVLYSSFIVNKKADTKVLIIDNIGMLSSLYAYGNVGYVGGGFLKGGIHNTLEPAIFGLPIVFGPVYQKFTEAVSMVAEGVAFPVHTQTEAMTILTSLVNDEQRRDMINQKLKHFMDSNTGATERILANIRNKGWLS
jgi:3-deoxy-D-manno-octulosonic-acid transferase